MTTPSCVAMATSAASSSAAASSSSATSHRQCVGRAPGMLLGDIFELCGKSKEDILRWLRRQLIIGDFTDQDYPRCTEGWMRLVRYASYSKDEMVWKCTNRKCNKKVSVRKGSWLEGSHLTLEQIFMFSYMWVWRCDQEFIMRVSHGFMLHYCSLV